MQTVSLGRCGFEVSRIGYGARWVAPKNADDEQLRRGEQALRRALELGITHIDTAGGYGDSEAVIGRVLEETGYRPVIATKVWAEDPGVIRERCERSLELLRRPSIDIFLIHRGRDVWKMLPTFQRLKEEGLITAIGVSAGRSVDLAREIIDEGSVDVLQLRVNIAHRRLLDEGVVELAIERGLGVQIMSPFSRGILTGPHEAIAPLAPYGIDSLDQASLRFLLDNAPGVVPIPGSSRPERVERLVSMVDLPPVPREVWRQVAERIDAVPELLEMP